MTAGVAALLAACSINPEPIPTAGVSGVGAGTPASGPGSASATGGFTHVSPLPAGVTILGVSVTPATASLPWPNGGATPSTPFTAVVTASDGSTSSLVVWQAVSPAQVTISGTGGVGTAAVGPSPQPGTYVVMAASGLNPTVVATAAVTLLPAPVVGGTGN